MSAPRYMLLALLVLCLSITVSAYAGPSAGTQPAGAQGEQDSLISNGAAHDAMNHSSSSITSPIYSPLSDDQPGLPGSKNGGLGLSGDEDHRYLGPPTRTLNSVPEPDVLLDLGLGLTAFVTLLKFRVRRSG